MDSLILMPLLVAGVLLTSGVAKLRDPAWADAAFASLRVPDALAAPWLRRAVPWGEVALGAALLVLPGPVRVAAAAASVLLFVAYTLLIVRAWRAPGEVACQCFGGGVPSRVTGWTVVRNGALLAASLLAIADAAVRPPLPLARLADPVTAAWVAGSALVALTVATIVHEPSRPDAASAAPAVPPPGEEEGDYVRLPIPYGTLADLDGTSHHLRDLPRARAALLVWVAPGCGSCQTIIEELPAWREAFAGVDVRAGAWPGATQTLVDRGVPADALLVDERGGVLSLFRGGGTPSAVLLGVDGLLAGGPVTGADAVRAFVADIRAELAEAGSGPADAEA